MLCVIGSMLNWIIVEFGLEFYMLFGNSLFVQEFLCEKMKFRAEKCSFVWKNEVSCGKMKFCMEK